MAEDYLNGFSPNVQDILDNFKFRNQLTTLSKADAIGTLINKFLDPDLSPAGSVLGCTIGPKDVIRRSPPAE